MRVAIIGGGTIAALFVDNIRRGALRAAQVVAIAGRSNTSRAKRLAQENGIQFVTSPDALLAASPEVVVEAASHEAVGQYAEPLLSVGIPVIVLSCGALADDRLCERLRDAAYRTGALLYIPSGGIGALDALKGAMHAGVESVTMTTSKPPAAWRGIPYVERLNFALDAMDGPRVLYEGPARAAVVHFPQNVNIAAALSLAGIGFDRTSIRLVADPGTRTNTHRISIRAKSGNIDVTLENVPAPDNPKTAWLACYSALAALAQMQSPVRVGT
jgi:aspartate dehydrogenase